MRRYTDADALYEKTAEWEAKALAHIEKLNKIPFEEMTKEEYIEWRVWSAILSERSAFKYDVYDAPSADVRENVHGEWLMSDESKLRPYMCSNCGCLHDVDTVMGKIVWQFCPNCGAQMDERSEDGLN